jgi:predicted ribosomally synthesized peptide with nif11-like leader
VLQDSVIQFFDTIFQNKQLQGQLNQVLAKVAPQALIQIAQSHGYNFTIEDLKAVLTNQGELSEQQLGSVAGGATPKFIDFSDEPLFIEVKKPPKKLL